MAQINTPNKITSKNHKIFVPRKTPRYLRGDVSKAVWVKDLQLYNEHRYKVFTATPRIDCDPPKLNVMAMLRPNQIYKDLEALQIITNENFKLMMKINVINRTHGRVDCFNNITHMKISKFNKAEFKKVEKDNISLYNRLISKKSEYSRDILQIHWQKALKQMSEKGKYPLLCSIQKTQDQILSEKKSISQIPSNIVQSMGRPKVFLELGVENYLPIGKILIELYSDIVPQSVALFLTRVEGKDRKPSYVNQCFYRIIPNEYCELGDKIKELTKTAPVFTQLVPKENFILQHTRPGVVSFVPSDRDSEKTTLLFSITFDQYKKFDNQRVVIGKVIRGYKNLLKLQDFGKKIGRSQYKIFIKSCGIYVGRTDYQR